MAGHQPMIRNQSAETRHEKIHVRIPERLSKLTRIPREEITERAKEIHAVEAIRYVGTQSDAIHSSANLPKVFPPTSENRYSWLDNGFRDVCRSPHRPFQR